MITSNKKNNRESGQALITLLFFVVIAIAVTSAAVVVLAANSLAATKLEEGTTAYYAAESGIENALLQLVRNPSYTGETNLQVGTATVTITVTPGNPITILSTAQEGNFIRKIQVQAQNNAILTISSWNEVY